MDANNNKIDELTLALMYLRRHGQRAWKSFDWESLNRLYQRGLISNPKQKSHSVIFSAEAEELAQELFQKWFIDDDPEVGLPWEHQTYKVELVDGLGDPLDPPVHRVFSLRSTNVTFADLYLAIRDACGWEGVEAHEFLVELDDNEPLCESNPYGETATGRVSEEMFLSAGFSEDGETVYFRYDTEGAAWPHRVTRIETTHSPEPYFRRLGGDIEGVFPHEGFATFQEFLAARAEALDLETPEDTPAPPDDLVDHVRVGIVAKGLAYSFDTNSRVYDERFEQMSMEIGRERHEQSIELSRADVSQSLGLAKADDTEVSEDQETEDDAT